jgi:hypothetical protein
MAGDGACRGTISIKSPHASDGETIFNENYAGQGSRYIEFDYSVGDTLVRPARTDHGRREPRCAPSHAIRTLLPHTCQRNSRIMKPTR